jgi:23S rRNA (uracil747-C5)-methyltransferase
VQCDHFDAGTCRSCTLIPVPHAQQITSAQDRYRELLAPYTVAADAAGSSAVPGTTALGSSVWGPPVTSPDARFRATAKMVVTGTAQDPVLGILGPGGTEPGVDLADCPLYPPGVEPLLEDVRALIRRAQVPPYSVARRKGELKYVLVTVSPDDEYMVRLVLRSEKALDRIREHMGRLLTARPRIRVLSANIHPEHKAVLEGPTEIHLAGDTALPMRMRPAGGDDRGITLQVRPRSFVQTNSAVAARLYAQVGAWIEEIDPSSVWDLYCGVGGFALHCAHDASAPRPREVVGVEISPEAIASATSAAGRAGLEAIFHAADATSWAIAEAARSGPPQAVIVNPPRRGIGERLADWIEHSGVDDVVYSSCNPATLATDLAAMPSYAITAARLVDMFPHTRHDEVLVRLHRQDPQ